MKKSLLYFSILILVLNCLFLLIGFGNDAVEVAIFMGGLMAIGTDPVIIAMAILIGTALVVKQSSLSVIYFILASVVGATVVHYMLGTTKLIVDIIRVDALLIIPSIIIIVASFFEPKSKATTKKIKYTELPIHKPLRIIILIFTAVMLWVFLLNEDRSEKYFNNTPFSKYITKYIIWNNAFADRKINWCTKTNEPSAGYLGVGREDPNFKKQFKAYMEWKNKNECKFYPEELLIAKGMTTKEEINKFIEDGSTYVNYYWNYDNHLYQQVTHWIIALISMVAVWKYRFCIAYIITTPMFTPPEPKPKKSNLVKAIKNFFKSI